ncbi:alpha/beta hydrolase [Bacillus paramycoides]|uniref:Alpha/beta hydrolase n=1 Tax=Bacillus paramycoides TaxID=2026194 RepID=A0ABU6N1S9_9BACI|nr:alpha/beta hydrolase [Bacillus paramycoides]MED0987871.1 alpha/beta hydrolase [Bacillus paramycoides]MED1569066.1 alpha/beta hydrolase [Bacillus paramycoides]
MKRYFIHNRNKKVHITEWGNKKNPVIFCLHGLGGSSLTFIEVADTLKDEYRFVAIDAPGHGKTEPLELTEEYEMLNIIDWLNEIVDILEIDQFYSLSHSWGSFVSLFYVNKYPQRIKGTMLIDGGYQTKRLKVQTLEEEVAHYEADFDEYVFDSWDDFFKTEKAAYIRWSPMIEAAVKDLAVEKEGKVHWHASGTTAVNIIKAMHKHETIDIYEKLPSSIILLRATEPNSWNEYRNKTAKIFEEKTKGTVKLIPESTHMLHWDYPEIVVDEIRKNWSFSQTTI